MKINEVSIEFIKPKNGLVGFASFVIEGIYYSSVGIFTRPTGGYRLTYPTKRVGNRDLHLFHPINRQTAYEIEEKILTEFKKLRGNEYDNHNNGFLS